MKDFLKVVSRKASIKCILTITSLFIVILGMSKVHAQEHTGYRTGFNTVSLGHSFLKPGAEQLNILAPEYNYLLHKQYRPTGYGSHKGAPGWIWTYPPTCDTEDLNSNGLCPDDPKNLIIDEDVELLVLTAYLEPDAAGNLTSDHSNISDYVNWVRYTLLRNPNTFDTVAIIVPWAHYAANNDRIENSLQDYHEINLKVSNYIEHTIISKLRAIEEFQHLEFLHIAGGNAAVALLHEYENGNLSDDVVGAVCPDPHPTNSYWPSCAKDIHLMYDRRGHAGTIFEDLLGLVWQKTIYPDTDIKNLPRPSTITEWNYDLRNLAHTVWEMTNFSKRLNDQPIEPTEPQFILINDVISENDAIVNNNYEGTNSTLANNALDVNFDPLTFAKVSGPSWLIVAEDGKLSGIPNSYEDGLNTFRVSVNDGTYTVEGNLQINVNAESNNIPPVFLEETIEGTVAPTGTEYLISLAGSASDMDDDTLTYSFDADGIHDCSDSSSWLQPHSDPQTDEFSGTPGVSEIGTTKCSIKVEDGQGGSDTAILEISVE